MQRIIFFDTETTGLGDADLVEICWMIYEDGVRLVDECFVIKPDGWIIPATSTAFHKITHEDATIRGVPLRGVMERFLADLEGCDVVVAHNLRFDCRIIHHVCSTRLEIDAAAVWAGIKEFCTYENARQEDRALGTAASHRYTLGSLYYATFGQHMNDAHSARGDSEALQQIFWQRWRNDVENNRLATSAPSIVESSSGAVGSSGQEDVMIFSPTGADSVEAVAFHMPTFSVGLSHADDPDAAHPSGRRALAPVGAEQAEEVGFASFLSSVVDGSGQDAWAASLPPLVPHTARATRSTRRASGCGKYPYFSCF
jgi:DNA polymerase-3 subunit epsilon